jgi:hypothetical protein
LEAQLEGRDREVQALQMALHHCEMDVVRMRAAVDAVAQVAAANRPSRSLLRAASRSLARSFDLHG